MSPEVQNRDKSGLIRSTDALRNRVKTTVMILPFKFARAVADLRRGPLYGPNFSQFHAVFWKIWQNPMLAPPPTGNPGSTPVDI